jgi:serine/threonine protein kinase
MINLIGQKLGEYEIVEQIGEGGMAAVYRARQPSVERDVAVKVIQTSQTNPQSIAKFEQESRLIASLSHPNIIKVFGVGVLRGFHLKLLDSSADARQDLVYFAMELLRGGTLAMLLERGPLTVQQTRLFTRQIAGALDYAHQKGIAHCDLKPANILFDENNNAILCDFGIATLTAERLKTPDDRKITGTPFYMSPEQWRGEPTGSTTDVYALGVILWEMFTGQPPFAGETVSDLYRAHTLDAIPHILDHRPELPLAVQEVFEKALAKDPAARFPYAGQLMVNLDRALGVRGSRIVTTTRRFVTVPGDESQPAKQIEVVRDLRPLIVGAALAGVGIIFLIVALLVASRTAVSRWTPVDAKLEAGSIIGTLAAGTATTAAIDATNRAIVATLSPNGDVQATISAYSVTSSR